ncbi:enoyl-CoA hydratase [Neobacillus niacini]|uniref:enoyl-CoA hydratase n=1 Tax=Neobacillus niacini TaxID=86668 RepID=UPI00277E93F2|nr:enoyl-CoA hydratase [Neobacillus niacini]MDQ1002184.1 enoyl-CoA hydratase [Neobacillus niacini]
MVELVSVKKEAGIALVTIDNPPVNALSRKVLEELASVFANLEDDPGANVVILTGAGNRAFVAGGDIKSFPKRLNMKKSELKLSNMENHEIYNQLANFPKPTIAFLNGYTFGGGCELALTCDIRIAEEQVQLGLPEVKLGLFPGGGGTQRLPRLIGEAKAKELMFTGEAISASEAKEIGLVNQVVPEGEGLQASYTVAKKMVNHSLQALSRIKRVINEGAELPLSSGLELEAEEFASIFQTQDVREGVQAFLEKRKPNFQHR